VVVGRLAADVLPEAVGGTSPGYLKAGVVMVRMLVAAIVARCSKSLRSDLVLSREEMQGAYSDLRFVMYGTAHTATPIGTSPGVELPSAAAVGTLAVAFVAVVAVHIQVARAMDMELAGVSEEAAAIAADMGLEVADSSSPRVGVHRMNSSVAWAAAVAGMKDMVLAADHIAEPHTRPSAVRLQSSSFPSHWVR
jgi:hypothetical protein